MNSYCFLLCTAVYIRYTVFLDYRDNLVYRELSHDLRKKQQIIATNLILKDKFNKHNDPMSD